MTPLGAGVSMGVHESQSRIYENQIGRGRGMTGWLYGRMVQAFGDVGVGSAEAFYKAVNRVQPGFIRTEADEVHYNLHIMMRFDLERAFIRGDLAVGDIEAAWNDRFKADFGVAVDRPRAWDVAGCPLVGGALRLFPDLYAGQCLCRLPVAGAAGGGAGGWRRNWPRAIPLRRWVGCGRICRSTVACAARARRLRQLAALRRMRGRCWITSTPSSATFTRCEAGRARGGLAFGDRADADLCRGLLCLSGAVAGAGGGDGLEQGAVGGGADAGVSGDGGADAVYRAAGGPGLGRRDAGLAAGRGGGGGGIAGGRQQPLGVAGGVVRHRDRAGGDAV